MPEFPERSIKKLASEGIGGPYEQEESIRKRVEALNLKYRGSGAECTVMSIPGKDERVFAVNYEWLHPTYARQLYYSQRILSTLFPHNFPPVRMSSGTMPGSNGISGTVRDTVEGKKGSEEYSPGYDWNSPGDKMRAMMSVILGTRPEIRYPFGAARKAIKEMGIRIHLDTAPFNFMLSKDGEEFYVDMPDPKGALVDDSEKIMQYMQEHEYTEHQRRVVEVALERLRVLNDVAAQSSTYNVSR